MHIGRPCFSSYSKFHPSANPTPGIVTKKVAWITELLSRRCYTGLGFSFFAEELPGRASRERALRFSSATVWRASG